MSKFNYEAYRKVYPEVPYVAPTETAVEGFHPTEEAQAKVQNEAPGESIVDIVDAPETPDVDSADMPEGEET